MSGNIADYPGLKMKKNQKKLKVDFNKGGKQHQGDPGRESMGLEQVERQIRTFIDDVERRSLSLPPMEKELRAQVHKLATCFRLKSKSTGKGQGRATTLTKGRDTVSSSRGFGVNEQKVNKIVRKAGKKAGEGVRHKDGDVVGAHAKRIDESNIGFKLLQSMG